MNERKKERKEGRKKERKKERKEGRKKKRIKQIKDHTCEEHDSQHAPIPLIGASIQLVIY